MSQTTARALTSSELAATFDLMTPLATLLEKCHAEDSEKAITQASDAFAQQINQCRELVGRLEPVHCSIEELQKELGNLQKTLTAKMEIAERYNLLKSDTDIDMVDV